MAGLPAVKAYALTYSVTVPWNKQGHLPDPWVEVAWPPSQSPVASSVQEKHTGCGSGAKCQVHSPVNKCRNADVSVGWAGHQVCGDSAR
jgi:hypothetical protein